MNESRENMYHSLPHTHPSFNGYADHEQTLTLDDEEGGIHGSAHLSFHGPTTTLKQFNENRAFDEELRPPSLFDGIPPAPAHMEGPRAVEVLPVTHAQRPYAPSHLSSRSFYEAKPTNQITAYADPTQNANNLIPIIELAPQPAQPQPMFHPMHHPPMVQPIVPAPRYAHHKLGPNFGVVPPTISQSILSQGSASKLVPEVEEEEEEYRKGVNKCLLMCCVVVVLAMIIAAVVAAAILQIK